MITTGHGSMVFTLLSLMISVPMFLGFLVMNFKGNCANGNVGKHYNLFAVAGVTIPTLFVAGTYAGIKFSYFPILGIGISASLAMLMLLCVGRQSHGKDGLFESVTSHRVMTIFLSASTLAIGTTISFGEIHLIRCGCGLFFILLPLFYGCASRNNSTDKTERFGHLGG